MILLIDNYDSFTFNLVHLFGAAGVAAEVHRNDRITVEAAIAARPDAVVLSPGPGGPLEAGICVELVRACEAAAIPLLGVCLGHQAIGAAFGAAIVRAPVPMHGKVDRMHHRPESEAMLFRGLPDPFEATRYHSLVVDPATLPERLAVTARTADGLIMGLSHRSAPIHGVQFHPESIASPCGAAIVANFLASLPAAAGGAPAVASAGAVAPDRRLVA